MARATTFVLVGALAGGACGGGQPRARASVLVPSVPAGLEAIAPGRPGEGRRAAAAAGAPRLEMPRDAGCKLGASTWPFASLSLRFRPDAPPYAEVAGGAADVDVALPLGGAELGAMVDVEAFGVRLRGNVAADQVPLYPAAPFLVAGVVVPSGSTRLTWEATGRDAVEMRLPPGRRVQLAEAARRVRWPCGGVALAETSFPEGEAAGLPPLERVRSARLRAGASVPVAEAPGGPARATIEPGPDDPDEVLVLAARGAASRIAWWLPDDGDGGALVVGWVASALLRPNQPRSSWGVIGGTVGCALGGGPSGCLGGAGALIAEVEGERLVVGSVLGGTRALVEPGGDDDEFVVVTSFERGAPGQSVALPIQAAPGARLLMRRADVGRCGG